MIRSLRILLSVILLAILIFVGVIFYQIRHPKTEAASDGTSNFPALNLLSEEIDSDSASLIQANLQIYTTGKFNPATAYILAKDYSKTANSDGTTNFQFYITVPEVQSTYQINFTTNFLNQPMIDLVCASAILQPKNSPGCYQPPAEESFVEGGLIYA